MNMRKELESVEPNNQILDPPRPRKDVVEKRNSSRRRKRVTPLQHALKPYRVEFSCKNAGRYFRSSKRRIRWVFGFTSSKAAAKGELGRGEEQEVELVWSVKSKKVRLFWNRQLISNLLANSSGIIEFAWQCRSGKKLNVIVRTDKMDPGRQYDLMVDGVSFYDLPALEDLTIILPKFGGGFAGGGDVGEKAEVDAKPNRKPCQEEDFRLAMAGLISELSADDELQSELFTPLLESLRQRIIGCLPQTEEMVSRAIMNAFSIDSDSLSTDHSHFTVRSSSDSSLETDPYQVEVDSLRDAYQWVRTNRYREEDVALLFFQKHINSVFVAIRTEELVCDAAAARILLGVGTVLNLTFATSIPKDTILLFGLPTDVEVGDLESVLAVHGCVESPAIATVDRAFGFCRFRTELAASRAVSAANEGKLMVNGHAIQAVLLSESNRDVVGDGAGVSEERPARAFGNPDCDLVDGSIIFTQEHENLMLGSSDIKNEFFPIPSKVVGLHP